MAAAKPKATTKPKVKRRPDGTILPGQVLNPHGNYAADRTFITSRFMKDLMASYEEDGITAIRRLRDEHPDKFCQLIVSLAPKDINLNVTDESYVELLKTIGPRVIEGETVSKRKSNGKDNGKSAPPINGS